MNLVSQWPVKKKGQRTGAKMASQKTWVRKKKFNEPTTTISTLPIYKNLVNQAAITIFNNYNFSSLPPQKNHHLDFGPFSFIDILIWTWALSCPSVRKIIKTKIQLNNEMNILKLLLTLKLNNWSRAFQLNPNIIKNTNGEKVYLHTHIHPSNWWLLIVQ